MDPVSVGLLAALVGGVGGEAGRQAWASLTALVRRPFRGDGDAAGDAPQVSAGLDELARLEENPADPARAQALSTALAVRAALDADFRRSLEAWHEQAKRAHTGGGTVHNEVKGGNQYGPVVMGQNFSNLSFGSPAAAPAPPPTAQQDPDHSNPPQRG
ncbi:hypothetical protein GCM10017687_65810 [Streptomyces echinatus]